MRYSPVFHLEDFFDRYSDLGHSFDGAHISFADILVDPTQGSYTGHDLYAPRPSNVPMTSATTTNGMPAEPASPPAKRKASSSSRKKHVDLKVSHRNSHPDPNTKDNLNNVNNTLMSPNGMSEANLSMHQQQQALIDPNAPPLTPFPPHSTAPMPNLSQTPFSPPYAFSSLNTLNHTESYDPMFGMPQMGYGYGNGISGCVNGMGNMGGGMPQEGMTPGGRSNGESTGTNGEEKDPFLSLLEQLAENEYSRGGPSELDFFLSGGNG
jgi:hypothetical protein